MRLLFLLALLIAAPAAFAQAPANAATVLDRLEATYASLDAVEASFEQQMGDVTLIGTLALQGERFRVELPGQTIVSDGETAWSYSEADRSVLISRVADDPAFFSPGELFLRYPERFDVAVQERVTRGGVALDVLALTPKDAADVVEAATLFVRAADGVPTRVEVETQGQRVTIELSDIRLNPPLEADRFTFEAPQGAEVIDLRS